MNREFLKEAIADAKAVKETAIANAKAALEESFTPHLKTVLSAKLEEMEKEDMDEGYDEMDEAKDEMDEMKKDLDEAMATIETLRSELNEINLLNAKLLYTNKVFRGKNLTESQKVKVLGAFDKAETIKEVKLVFETIDGAVKAKATNKSISEGVRAKGSASNLSATPKVTKKQPIVESDEMVSRFKKLAGII